MPLLAYAALFLAQTSDRIEGSLKLSEHWLIEMPVEIEGNVFRMLVSTGAERTILRPGAFAKITGQATGGNQPLFSARSFDIRVRGKVIGTSQLVGADLWLFKSEVENLKPFDGILGRDLIRQRVWMFDYVRRRYRVLPKEAGESDLPSGIERVSTPESVEKGYFLPVKQGGTKGNAMLDTGATIFTLDARQPSLLLYSLFPFRPAVVGVNGPTSENPESVPCMYASLTVGGQRIDYPVIHPSLLRETSAIGILGPYSLGVRAVAFFPDGQVGLWPEHDRDVRRSRALQRLTGLDVRVRGERVFLVDSIFDKREVEVLSIEGISSADLLSLVHDRRRLFLPQMDRLWRTYKQVKIRFGEQEFTFPTMSTIQT